MKLRFVLLAAALLAWCSVTEGRPSPGTSGKHNEDLDGIGADLEEFLNHRDQQNTRQRESQNVYSSNRNNYNPSSILSSILGTNSNRPSGSSSSSVVRPSYPSAPAAAPARPSYSYPSAPSAPPARPSYPAAPSAPLYPSLPSSDSSSVVRPGSSGSGAPYPSSGGWMLPQSNSAPKSSSYPSYPSNSAPAKNPPYPSYPNYPSYPSYQQQSYPSYSNRQSGYPTYSNNGYGGYQGYNRPYPVQPGMQSYNTNSARRNPPPPPPGSATTKKPSKSITSRISNFFKKITN